MNSRLWWLSTCLSGSVLLLAMVDCRAQSVASQAVVGPSAGQRPSEVAEDAASYSISPELNRFLTGMVLENMPHQYEEKKKWGHQVQRWAGFEFRRDGPGGKLETQRKFKMVNDGTWRKYSAALIDPNKSFSVKLQEISRTPEGKTAFQISFSTDLKIDARQSKWVHGVQMYSISAEGHARVNLKIGCELGIGIDFGRLPPDLVFQPTITDAQIAIEQFKIDRISKAGGEVAVQLTRLARKELEEKIDKKERRLVEKLNKKIAENEHKLRLSTADAVRLKWYGQASEFLPGNVQSVLAD